ncbi:hypothetical protein KDA_74570 [Dictyobacter alpinus]|uniref:Uncharacterized protein n=1 Tax=Dictyobacter alpinus TaxID=2014873 RepID=A0A402BKS5_9CHLR|nr:hypothetical protein [Dictyobacter alpinus]GCE31973.1 hypothetical protein KDA_74570 [Dictyobacter alpinus]
MAEIPRPEREEQEAYVLDEQDQQELETFKLQLEPVQQQITALEAQLERLFPRDISDHFHLGMVGRGGRASAKLNKKKLGAMDRSFEVTKKLEPLYRERTRLTALITDVTSGRRKQQREKQARLEQWRQEAEARVRLAVVGDYVLDSAFGLVKVVRKNRKSLTIETSSGYREPRPFELIKDVASKPAPAIQAMTGPRRGGE